MTAFFFFNDTATTEIYTLSLHDALPIWLERILARQPHPRPRFALLRIFRRRLLLLQYGFAHRDRKSTRLNSSHSQISYAVFCLKKKNSMMTQTAGLLTQCTYSAMSPALN